MSQRQAQERAKSSIVRIEFLPLYHFHALVSFPARIPLGLDLVLEAFVDKLLGANCVHPIMLSRSVVCELAGREERDRRSPGQNLLPLS